ncbi:mitochondrial DnaJ homolog 2 [[Candida] jaroonii]|uniref:Mitochondrial DnaJ homolog 2 n=1 Tax=[Candida] jaroonii TaxID=467808 RepID=A0ACA9YEG2_9ASCO|nr:mitochondrial DnaJ homolog 2 [[Candida] jaroonii]
MVLPIIAGIGVSLLALTVKTTISAYRKYLYLTPEMIASLNNITIKKSTRIDHSHPHSTQHSFIRDRYPNTGFQPKMTEEEALKVLGIEGDDIVNLNKQFLKNRYRKLIIMNHPDKNGSQFLSQKINEAKDILERSYLFRNK